MLDRGDRDTRPFGRRRPDEVRPPPDAAEGWSAPEPSAGPLRWALRTAAVAGFAAVLATQYLVRVSSPGEDAAMQVAFARHGGGQADPETTGSIGRSAAQATRLDPCAVAAPARPRP